METGEINMDSAPIVIEAHGFDASWTGTLSANNDKRRKIVVIKCRFNAAKLLKCF